MSNYSSLSSKSLIRLKDEISTLETSKFVSIVREMMISKVNLEIVFTLFDIRGQFISQAYPALECITFDRKIPKIACEYPLTAYILKNFEHLTLDVLEKEIRRNHNLISVDSLKDRFGQEWNINFPEKRSKADIPEWIIRKSKNEGVDVAKLRKTITVKRKSQNNTEIIENVEYAEDQHDILPEKDFSAISENTQRYLDQLDEKDDRKLVNLFGPRHVINDDICSRGIGDSHRMLRCICFETSNKWFSKYCDGCGTIIRKKSFAVRFPLAIGGFQGCYCSFDCMREFPAEDIDELQEYNISMLQMKIQNYKIFE